MLYTIAVIPDRPCGLPGLVNSSTPGGFIHVLLIVAVNMILVLGHPRPPWSSEQVNFVAPQGAAFF